MANIVVMGAGIGGISQVYELRKYAQHKRSLNYEKAVLKMLGAERLRDTAR
jgi:cation diffusion facilitator CzcD-associated flavoprotein CzcO